MSKYDIPYKKIIGDFVIDILTPNDIDVDFETCVENKIHLHGLFGDEWPHNLTRDEDLLDLYWHYYCFIGQKEFAWTIKLKNDTEYLGCCYYYPINNDNDDNADDNAEVYVWFKKSYTDTFKIKEFYRDFMGWIKGPEWPQVNQIALYTPENKKMKYNKKY